MTRYALALALLLPLGAQAQDLSAYSSASYLAVPASLTITDGLSVKSVAAGGAYAGLAYSSYQMHAADRPEWYTWEQVDLDMTVMSIAVVAADAWEPVIGKRWAWGALIPLGAYHALTQQRGIINSQDPILHSGIMAAVAFGGLAITEGWGVLPELLLFGAAVFVRVGLDADGVHQINHSLWHGLGAASATVSLSL